MGLWDKLFPPAGGDDAPPAPLPEGEGTERAAVMPTTPVLYRFEVLQDFTCPELRTQYVKGQRYNMRKGNRTLERFVRQWTLQGKVRLV